jgi:Helicase associated domain
MMCITLEQMLKFASIGFRFSHVLKNIDERIVQIQEFKKVHGHTQVPSDYTGHSGLGLWVKKTKDAYHLGKYYYHCLNGERLRHNSFFLLFLCCCR